MAIKKIGKVLLLSLSSLFIFAVFFFFTETLLLLRYSKELAFVVLNNKTDSFEDAYSKWHKHFAFAKNLPEILGKNSRKVYFVLLQNNTELRPTGGFLGSYAKLSFENCGLKELVVQDIYVPDGQLKGHVDPPAPIQQAFGQGWFKLRDANWEPDFPTSAKVISWFFDKGNEEKPDGIIAINLELIKDLLKIIGPLYLPDYKLIVDENNFYQIVQSNSEANFFSGSTQKANILSAVSSAMLTKITNLDLQSFLKIVKILYDNLNNRQILLNFQDKGLNEVFRKLNWDGSLKKVFFEKDRINDYLYVVEANLGANKANGYVKREIEQEIAFSQKGIISERVKIVFNNSSTYYTPIKPNFWGGDYINYLRLYLPNTVEKITIKVNGVVLNDKNLFYEEKKEFNLKGIGFFITVPALAQKIIEVNYVLPFKVSKDSRKFPYKIVIQKQPGVNNIPYSLNLIKNGKSILLIKKNLIKDTEIKAKIMYN